jgi:hypothetical protein
MRQFTSIGDRYQTEILVLVFRERLQIADNQKAAASHQKPANRESKMPLTPADTFTRLKILGLALGGTLILSACGGSDSPGEAANADIHSAANEIAAAVGDSSADQPATGSSCISDYAGNPCDLLTEAMVREHIASAGAEMEQQDTGAVMRDAGMRTNMGGMAINGCTYSWDGGRKIDRSPKPSDKPVSEQQRQINEAMAKMMSNLPLDDTVAFRSIQVLGDDDPLARFNNKWRAPTEEELKMLGQRMDEAMNEARDEGKINDAGADFGKEMGQSLTQAKIEYEDVDGIADAARWGGMVKTPALKVLDGDTEFEVAVDISDDNAVDRELSIAIAKDLLAACN